MPGSTDPDLVDRIHRRSQGQPLFTEQLAGLDDDRGAAAAPRRPARPAARPGSAAPAWAIARALGVADRPLPDALLGRGRRAGTGRAGGRACTSWGTAGCCAPSPGTDVELGHPLLAEAIRRRLVAFEVTDEHRRLALALARSADPSPAEVAEHWRRAEDPAEEVVWRVRAAQAAGRAVRRRPRRPSSGDGPSPCGRTTRSRSGRRPCASTTPTSPRWTLCCSPTWTAAWEVAEGHCATCRTATDVDAAATYRRAGSIRHWLDDPQGGLELVERALAIHRSASPSVEYVRALHEHDTLLSALGRYDEAARVDGTGPRAERASLDAPAAAPEPAHPAGVRTTSTPATSSARWRASTRPPASS